MAKPTDENEFSKRLKMLYPAVDEEETPLPRRWNSRDRFMYIGLSQDNLKVQYKGQGKSHRDAASVRATHAIPNACGIYYFEVTVVSKGRDGYMGIGLSAHGVNLNRLPGWDKLSYGYHGDDGHSFCSTGSGRPYGPTFTTGDVIGCCLNLVDNSCFYTKNGISIGTAFTELPSISLFPTVGLQTPNEELLANFGQHPFMFDFEDYLKEWKMTTQMGIEKYTLTDEVEFQSALHQLVSSYLIHHGYVASTEAFNQSLGQKFCLQEDGTSIRNRQRIQHLVLVGRIGEAIETTQHLFPGLFAKNPCLFFRLKVRQFIEMVNGTETEVKSLTKTSVSSNYSSPITSPKHSNWNASASDSPASSHNGFSPPMQQISICKSRSVEQKTGVTVQTEINSEFAQKSSGSSSGSDSDMETDSDSGNCGRGDSANSVVANGVETNCYPHGQMVVDGSGSVCKELCGGNPIAIEKMLQYGQQLLKLAKELKPEHTESKTDLNDAYSLLAYTDPWNSPVGYQLDPVEREPICSALNSAILESQGLPKRPPLLAAIGQAKQCLKKMISLKIGPASFVSISDYL